MKAKASLFTWFVTISFWMMGFALLVGIVAMVIQQDTPVSSAAVVRHEIEQ